MTPYRLLEVSSCICIHTISIPSEIEAHSNEYQRLGESSLHGFLFTKVCGCVVRAWKTHPACHRILRTTASPSALFWAHAAKPVLRPRSFMPICSLTLIGRPCNGPRGFSCSLIYSSSSWALARALWGKTSVIQFV